MKISCSVTPYHIYFTENDLTTYDTHLKVNPPLRTADDLLAVREALNNGIIDCIASHHIPLNWDDKTCEFENAHYGMIGLESTFGVLNSFSNDLEKLINQLTVNPRKIFGIDLPEINVNTSACLTLFIPNEKYIFDKTFIKSKSGNNAFIGKELKGKIIAIINKGKLSVN